MQYKIAFLKRLENQVWSVTHRKKVIFSIRGDESLKIDSAGKDAPKHLNVILKAIKSSKVITISEVKNG